MSTHQVIKCHRFINLLTSIKMSVKSFTFLIKVLSATTLCAIFFTQSFAKHVESLYGHPEERGPRFEDDLIMKPTVRNGKKYEPLRWKKREIPFVISSDFSMFVIILFFLKFH
jgi:hypothetical protein